MSSERTYRLGDLQLRIMKILWTAGPASVARVHEDLGGSLAYTTVATMLRKMEDRGLVAHEEQNRKFIYHAAIPAAEVTRWMADDLVDRLFQGSLADTVNHLLETREVSPQELAELERLIWERKRRP
jgi:predicted transcriptional regulator